MFHGASEQMRKIFNWFKRYLNGFHAVRDLIPLQHRDRTEFLRPSMCVLFAAPVHVSHTEKISIHLTASVCSWTTLLQARATIMLCDN